jgi:hypothetical protein
MRFRVTGVIGGQLATAPASLTPRQPLDSLVVDGAHRGGGVRVEAKEPAPAAAAFS